MDKRKLKIYCPTKDDFWTIFYQMDHCAPLQAILGYLTEYLCSKQPALALFTEEKLFSYHFNALFPLVKVTQIN